MIQNRNIELCVAFGNRLKAIRESKKMTQEQLANTADISISQISRLERGLLNPTLSTIFQLANAIEVPVSELINLE